MAEADRRRFSPRVVAAAVLATGLLLTVLSTYATSRVDFNTEQRLLQTQTKQAAAVLASAILAIELPLTGALDVQRSSPGDAVPFRRSLERAVGPGKTFVAATLWKRTGDDVRVVSHLGVPAALPAEEARSFVLRSSTRPDTFLVRIVSTGSSPRVAYAESQGGSPYVVLAERAVPANRRTPYDRNSAFADLHYATYIGEQETDAALATTDLPPADLPITRNEFRTSIPFGDTRLTVVTSAANHLGSDLSRWLPMILLVAGLLLSALAARLIYQLARSRKNAEIASTTIASLYQRVDSLYGEQRDVSERLQRALLPPSNPVIPGIEVATEYVAGARGVEIGGDWYSIIALDHQRFGFVVGDVSGRGIDAVAVMARARFTLRAYLADGHSPDEAIEKCSRQFDISVDGHLTTVLVGVGNSVTGRITLSSAGHPPPLLLTADAAAFAQVPVGPPLGAGPGRYTTSNLLLPPGATLVAYTDGLVERRGEDIESSLERLRRTGQEAVGEALGDFVPALLDGMRHAGEDDIAVLALRRTATARLLSSAGARPARPGPTSGR